MSIYCACGAQWHGKYQASAVIQDHVQRAQEQQGGCAIVPHDVFAARYRCECEACAAARRRGPRTSKVSRGTSQKSARVLRHARR